MANLEQHTDGLDSAVSNYTTEDLLKPLEVEIEWEKAKIDLESAKKANNEAFEKLCLSKRHTKVALDKQKKAEKKLNKAKRPSLISRINNTACLRLEDASRSLKEASNYLRKVEQDQDQAKLEYLLAALNLREAKWKADKAKLDVEKVMLRYDEDYVEILKKRAETKADLNSYRAEAIRLYTLEVQYEELLAKFKVLNKDYENFREELQEILESENFREELRKIIDGDANKETISETGSRLAKQIMFQELMAQEASAVAVKLFNSPE